MNNKNNTVKCAICNKMFESITDSHLKKHGIKLDEYRMLFGSTSKDFKQCCYKSENFSNVDNFTPWRCILKSSPESDLCILHSVNEQKNLEDFKITFTTLLKIYEASDCDCHFESVIFPDEFKLLDIVFNNNVIFSNSTFTGNMKFNVTFKQKAVFRYCKFFGVSDFSSSKFIGDATFEQAVFKGDINFKRTFFINEANFWRVEFRSNASFFQAQFHNRVYFGYGIFPNSPNTMIFIDTKFNSPKKVLFARIDLTSTLFRYSDLSQINFHNVKWIISPIINGKRRVLFDEINVDKNGEKDSLAHSYAEAKNLYQQLTRNFEEKRNFSEAGDFYFGEMECYRKSNILRRFLPSLVNLYRISSGYGQRYIRAGMVLILLLLTFSISHLFLGLRANEHNSNYSKISYTLDSTIKNFDTFIKDVFISTIYCTEVLIREDEPDRLFRPQNISGEILNSIFSVLVYVQMLFFILALRRHFKR